MLNKEDKKMNLEESIDNVNFLIRDLKASNYNKIFIQSLETVLQELERYQKLCIENLARSLNESINNEENNNEQLDALNEGWKKTIEDKIKAYEKLIDDISENEQYSHEIPMYRHDIQVLQELLNGHKEEI